jgi:hypothetical protein
MLFSNLKHAPYYYRPLHLQGMLLLGATLMLSPIHAANTNQNHPSGYQDLHVTVTNNLTAYCSLYIDTANTTIINTDTHKTLSTNYNYPLPGRAHYNEWEADAAVGTTMHLTLKQTYFIPPSLRMRFKCGNSGIPEVTVLQKAYSLTTKIDQLFIAPLKKWAHQDLARMPGQPLYNNHTAPHSLVHIEANIEKATNTIHLTLTGGSHIA